MTLSPLASRIIAWGLLANLCWVLGAFIVTPLLNQIGSDRETIASSQELLARYRRLEVDLPLIRSQLAALRESTENNRYFFVSASPAVAAAEMQNAMRGMVTSSGATLRSSKSLAASVEQGFDRVGIDLEVMASTPQLVGLLRAITVAEPVVLVDRLFVQTPETGAASGASDGQPAVAVTLRLISYARRPQIGSKS